MSAIHSLEPLERLAVVDMLRVTIIRIPLIIWIIAGSCSVSLRGITATIRCSEGDSGPWDVKSSARQMYIILPNKTLCFSVAHAFQQIWTLFHGVMRMALFHGAAEKSGTIHLSFVSTRLLISWRSSLVQVSVLAHWRISSHVASIIRFCFWSLITVSNCL